MDPCNCVDELGITGCFLRKCIKYDIKKNNSKPKMIIDENKD